MRRTVHGRIRTSYQTCLWKSPWIWKLQREAGRHCKRGLRRKSHSQIDYQILWCRWYKQTRKRDRQSKRHLCLRACQKNESVRAFGTVARAGRLACQSSCQTENVSKHNGQFKRCTRHYGSRGVQHTELFPHWDSRFPGGDPMWLSRENEAHNALHWNPVQRIFALNHHDRAIKVVLQNSIWGRIARLE